MTHLMTMNLAAEEAVGLIKQALNEAGLQVHSSFDLRSSRTIATNCLCQQNGTTVCDCQMVVLLLYGLGTHPTTLVVHSYNRQTWLTLDDRMGERPSTTILSLIRQAITAKQTQV